MEETKRENWADFAKGIGIILVRFGHQKIFGKKLIYLIYTFHMPLFFVISGYFYRGKNGVLKQIKHKAYTIMMPFFSYEILKWCLSVLGTFLLKRKLDLKLNFLLGVFFNAPDSKYSNPIWFFSCLFCAEVMFIIISKIVSAYYNEKKVARNILIITLVISGMAYIIYTYTGIKLPWNLDLALVMLPFLGVGYWIRENNILCMLKKSYSLQRLSIYGLLLIIVCVINAYFGKSNIDYAMRNYNEWISCVIVGIIGTLFLLIICLQIKENRLLKFIGKNSGLYYLMIGTVSQSWGKVCKYMFGTSQNEYIYFFLTLFLGLVTLIPICYILNRYFAFFIGKKKLHNARI